MDTSCIVLAGGKSSRLGHDKVLETVGNGSLLGQVVSRVSSICKNIIIVTARGRIIPHFDSLPEVKIVTDAFPGKGPMVGIYSGLAASSTFCNLAVASDMPFLNRDLLRYMLQSLGDYDMLIPKVGNNLEPLHAVYTKNCLATMEDMIKQDKLNLFELCNLVRVNYLSVEEIDRFDPEHLSFFNVNTTDDLKKARELSEGDNKR